MKMPKRRQLGSAALLVVLCLASLAGAEQRKGKAFDPDLGAIRVSGSWKAVTFILLTAEGRGVELPVLTDVPFGSQANSTLPAGYGPKGFWKEIPPGKYRLIAAAPAKRWAQVEFQLGKGEELWLRADLEEDQGKIAASEPLDQKTGPTWSKQDLIPVLQKLRWRQ